MLSNIYFSILQQIFIEKLCRYFKLRRIKVYIIPTEFYDLLSSFLPTSKILWMCFDMLSFEHNLLLPNNANLLRQVCIQHQVKSQSIIHMQIFTHIEQPSSSALFTASQEYLSYTHSLFTYIFYRVSHHQDLIFHYNNLIGYKLNNIEYMFNTRF